MILFGGCAARLPDFSSPQRTVLTCVRAPRRRRTGPAILPRTGFRASFTHSCRICLFGTARLPGNRAPSGVQAPSPAEDDARTRHDASRQGRQERRSGVNVASLAPSFWEKSWPPGTPRGRFSSSVLGAGRLTVCTIRQQHPLFPRHIRIGKEALQLGKLRPHLS
jgi:hypothetical protein